MFHGSIVALVTPMKADQNIDFDRLEQLIDWHIEEGTQAILVLGTTGESPTVTEKERKKIISKTVKHIKGRIPVMVGTGTNNTKTSIELTKQAMKLGADAALLVSPYYNKPTQEGLYQHYKSIAEAAAIPQVLYSVPARTGSEISIDTVSRLAKLPNIVAIKDSNDSLDRINELLTRCESEIDILTGNDSNALAYMLMGGKGVISVTANVVPKLMSQFCQAATGDNRKLAIQINKLLIPLNEMLFVESNPIPAKWLLKEMGKIDEGIRLPLTTLKKEHIAPLKAALENAKLN